jgi:heterodisulfide reductase subunit A-like polyferredoxin
LVIGGGCGGVAAALVASDLGSQVVLTEPGGCLVVNSLAKRCHRMSIRG